MDMRTLECRCMCISAVRTPEFCSRRGQQSTAWWLAQECTYQRKTQIHSLVGMHTQALRWHENNADVADIETNNIRANTTATTRPRQARPTDRLHVDI